MTGAVNPCGRLADTIARNYEDYPSSSNFGGKEYNEYKEDIYVGYRHFETYAKEKVLYPFGYGLSYTSFQTNPVAFVSENGVVITDWWMQKSASPEFPKMKDNAYRVRAQVDVLMPGNMGHVNKKYSSDGTLLKTIDKPNGITREGGVCILRINFNLGIVSCDYVVTMI